MGTFFHRPSFKTDHRMTVKSFVAGFVLPIPQEYTRMAPFQTQNRTIHIKPRWPGPAAGCGLMTVWLPGYICVARTNTHTLTSWLWAAPVNGPRTTESPAEKSKTAKLSSIAFVSIFTRVLKPYCGKKPISIAVFFPQRSPALVVQLLFTSCFGFLLVGLLSRSPAFSSSLSSSSEFELFLFRVCLLFFSPSVNQRMLEHLKNENTFFLRWSLL